MKIDAPLFWKCIPVSLPLHPWQGSTAPVQRGIEARVWHVSDRQIRAKKAAPVPPPLSEPLWARAQTRLMRLSRRKRRMKNNNKKANLQSPCASLKGILTQGWDSWHCCISFLPMRQEKKNYFAVEETLRFSRCINLFRVGKISYGRAHKDDLMGTVKRNTLSFIARKK